MLTIAMGGVTMTKPLVFSYKDYTDLRDSYKQLLEDNQTLMADNRELRKENAELKQLNDGYEKIIAKNQETTNKLIADLKVKVAEVESRYEAAASIIEINQGTIDGYHEIYRLQEIELKKLRNEVMNNESSTHDNKQAV